ncbi:MAG: 3-phosphoshikimate 1-carboxyvinyltransferase [Arcanobacterium sp.]|nr:3-phosphoshikimate 1-carboxyvinyltransferase [Arcanobacterium sp.]MDY5588504.1 3-phosphoshikimate 1-carboxyvinyltransferase [Arcanobacterium sp.]
MNLWHAPYVGNWGAAAHSGSPAVFPRALPMNSSVALPGSKSLTNRYLVLAALSDKPVSIAAPLVARDTLLMVQALEALGVLVRHSHDRAWSVFPTPRLQGGRIDCGLAGTVMRFVPPLAALAFGTSVIDGDPEARVRPLGAMVAGLRQLGVHVESDYGRSTAPLGIPANDASNSAHLPLRIVGNGAVPGGVATIDASASSQFVSGLLLAAPRFTHGLDLRHSGAELPSLPHIRMTLALLREAGVRVHEYDASGAEIFPAATAFSTAATPSVTATSGDDTPGAVHPNSDSAAVPSSATENLTAAAAENPAPAHPVRWVVEPGTVHLTDVEIEPDLSNAGPFLAAAMVCGGTVRISHWPAHTTQPGAQFPQIFEAMGGTARFIPDSTALPISRRTHGSSAHTPSGTLEMSGPSGAIRPLDMNLHAVGELVPTIAAVAAYADGESRLRDIGQLRGHETNRLTALCTELAKIGVAAREEGDDLVITPPRRGLANTVNAPQYARDGVVIHSYADHRMATFGAILGLRVPGLSVDDISTTAKTLPQFPQRWANMIEQSETAWEREHITANSGAQELS